MMFAIQQHRKRLLHNYAQCTKIWEWYKQDRLILAKQREALNKTTKQGREKERETKTVRDRKRERYREKSQTDRE